MSCSNVYHAQLRRNLIFSYTGHIITPTEGINCRCWRGKGSDLTYYRIIDSDILASDEFQLRIHKIVLFLNRKLFNVIYCMKDKSFMVKIWYLKALSYMFLFLWNKSGIGEIFHAIQNRKKIKKKKAPILKSGIVVKIMWPILKSW